MADTERQLPARSRRRGGSWVSVLAVLLVLAALVVVGDRVAAAAATRELRNRLVSELQAHDVGYQSLDVSIGGFPFLNQVAKGQYEQITIDVTDVSLPTGATGTTLAPVVKLSSLHAVGTQVDADTRKLLDGTATVTAATVDGTTVIPFSTLQTLVDFSAFHLSDVKFSQSAGGLGVAGTAALAGVSVPISAVADITVVNGVLQIGLRDAKALSVSAPPFVRDYLADLVQRNVTAKIPALPFGLVLKQVTVQADGLAVSAVGHNVGLATSDTAS